jgi:ubiquinone/menaquinone biosynthesis C-methylase UbiE
MQPNKAVQFSNPAAERYRQMRQTHWDAIARRLDTWRGWGGSFHRRLTQIYRYLVSPHQRVLEVDCGQADLLAALIPLEGVSVDFSPEMVRQAGSRHPENKFILADAHDLSQSYTPIPKAKEGVGLDRGGS